MAHSFLKLATNYSPFIATSLTSAPDSIKRLTIVDKLAGLILVLLTAATNFLCK